MSKQHLNVQFLKTQKYIMYFHENMYEFLETQILQYLKRVKCINVKLIVLKLWADKI